MDVGTVYYRYSSHLSQNIHVSGSNNLKLLKDELTLKEGSLFNICLKFISLNLNLIDSFVGLPEVIGRQLFFYMQKENVFHFDVASGCSPSDRLKWKTLALFDDAYKELVLKSLTLESFDEDFDIIPLLNSFRYMVELDLSGRILYDEVISLIPNLYCLEKLILQNNKLNDKSITKLTLPYRLYKENPQKLEILDLSGNELISNQSLEHLLIFSNLKNLNLTGTAVKMHYSLVYELKQFGWQISRYDATYSRPKTIGWAEQIISALDLQSKDKSSIESSKAKCFYFGKIKQIKTLEKNSSQILILTRDWFPTPQRKFCKNVLMDSHEIECVPTVNKNKKRKHVMCAEDNIRHGKQSVNAFQKNMTYFDNSEDNVEIFTQCISSNSHPRNKCLLKSLNDL